MTKHRIIQNGKQLGYLEEALAAQYDVHFLAKEADPKAYLAQHGGEFAALVTSAGVGADAALIGALPNIKVISSFGVGYEKVDVAAARARGIPVGYTPDVLNDCVADTAFALVLDVARRYTESDKFLRQGNWLKGNFPLATKVSRKRMGILGLGRIGAAIAQRARGFDMEVRYHNRKPVAGSPYGYEASLKSLAEWCDFLVIAAAGGAETRHMVSREILTALGPKGFVVNIARGSVIDEQALIEALEKKEILGAGLDVFEDEPRVPERLIACENTVLFPHLASGTFETRKAMADQVLDNLAGFFKDGKVPVAVP